MGQFIGGLVLGGFVGFVGAAYLCAEKEANSQKTFEVLSNQCEANHAMYQDTLDKMKQLLAICESRRR